MNTTSMPSGLASRAVSLASMGVSDVAWSKEDALDVVRWALGAEFGIFGGDLWIDRKGTWSAGVDGWSCEIQEGESAEAFVARSCEQAIAYVSSYPEAKRLRYIYSVEFADRESFLRLQGIGIREAAMKQLQGFDERFGGLNIHWSEPELREWKVDRSYHAELRANLRREGKAVAMLAYHIFDSDVLITSTLELLVRLRHDIENLLTKHAPSGGE